MANAASKTIYLDTLFSGLIPLKNSRLGSDGKAYGEVARNTGAYKKGETVSDFPRQFVHKLSRRSGPFILVKKADLSHKTG